MNKWLRRWNAIEADWARLKAQTKNFPAWAWTQEYRELADVIGTMGREHFNVDILRESIDEKNRKESPLEAAYRVLCEMQARFPHCPFCGRKFPGHCQDTCIIVRTYAAIREENSYEAKDEKIKKETQEN
jgi:hypothetical protein